MQTTQPTERDLAEPMRRLPGTANRDDRGWLLMISSSLYTSHPARPPHGNRMATTERDDTARTIQRAHGCRCNARGPSRLTSAHGEAYGDKCGNHTIARERF